MNTRLQLSHKLTILGKILTPAMSLIIAAIFITNIPSLALGILLAIALICISFFASWKLQSLYFDSADSRFYVKGLFSPEKSFMMDDIVSIKGWNSRHNKNYFIKLKDQSFLVTQPAWGPGKSKMIEIYEKFKT